MRYFLLSKKTEVGYKMKKRITAICIAALLITSLAACSQSSPQESSEESSTVSESVSVKETKKLTKTSIFFGYDEDTDSAFKAKSGEFGFLSSANMKRHEGFVDDDGELNCRTHSKIDIFYELGDNKITIKVDGNTYILQKIDEDMYTKYAKLINEKIDNQDESSDDENSEESHEESSEETSEESSKTESSSPSQESSKNSESESSKEQSSKQENSRNEATDPNYVDPEKDYTASLLGNYGSVAGCDYYGDYMLYATEGRNKITVTMKMDPTHVDLEKYGGSSTFFASFPPDTFKQKKTGKYWFSMDLYNNGTKTGTPLHIDMSKEFVDNGEGGYWKTICHLVYGDYSHDVTFYRAY